jgi:hypothetical protein
MIGGTSKAKAASLAAWGTDISGPAAGLPATGSVELSDLSPDTPTVCAARSLGGMLFSDLGTRLADIC